MKWTETLLYWYDENQRDFPWRKSRNPYHVWLSEIILQQTRVEQGLPYYNSFVSNFPTVFDLAAADEEKVLKLWQGLGYYSRARNLHASARWIVNERKGVFPQDYKSLLQLKGVGDYTASAIASICYEEPQAVVDGNVYRFLSRCFGISTPIDTGRAHKEFKAKATQLMADYSPNLFNQAMMEFGALHCTPKQAKCTSCPFHSVCYAFQQQSVYEYPLKAKRTKIRKRYFNYLVVKTPNGETLIQKRAGKGIWQNLYEFPLIETKSTVNKKQLLEQENFPSNLAPKIASIAPYEDQPIKHLLSHQHLFIQFWEVKLNEETEDTVSLKALKDLPVPVVIQHFIDNHYWR